jgi:hypothetical protein
MSENTSMHPIQIAGDYFVSYTAHNFSAKRDKMYVGKIIYVLSCAFYFINFEQKIAEVLTFYQSGASRH